MTAAGAGTPARSRLACALPFLAYVLAALIGALAVAGLMPAATIAGDGGLWTAPAGDIAQNVTGHLALQADGWRFPPLVAGNLMWPHGLSIAMTDSNPFMSLLGKLVADIRGETGNLMGIWFAACWVLQPVAAVYAVRSFGARRLESMLAAAVFSVCFPALLARTEHMNLCAHFILLLALGLAARMVAAGDGRRARAWLLAGGLLTFAILVHPYLFVFSAALLAAPLLQVLLQDQRGRLRATGYYLAACAVPVLVYGGLSGALGGAEKRFGYYSMNLLSPIWAQRSGVFGASLPVLDATGGQYEGFNYLGAGGLVLIGLAVLAGLLGRRAVVPPGAAATPDWRPLLLVLAGLALLSLSTRVYAGDLLLVSVLVKPMNQIFGLVQSSGRAFWAVGYALILGSIVMLERRLPRPALGLVLAAVVGLQVADVRPLQADARAVLSGTGQRAPVIAIPPGARLLTIPSVCTADPRAEEKAATLRYAAIRAGLLLSDIKVSRLPRWFNCEIAVSDGAELPLRDGEIRLFLETGGQSRFRLEAMGAGVACGQQDGMIACSRGLGVIWPDPPPYGAPLREVATSVAAQGTALDPLLSFGWQHDAAGLAWSEGPRATLLFRVPPSVARTGALIRLGLEGVARRPGQVRPVVLRAGEGAGMAADLPDLQPAVLEVPVAPAAMPDGIVRIAIDIDHPVDPTARGIAAPVGRAGVRLVSLDVAPLVARPAGNPD